MTKLFEDRQRTRMTQMEKPEAPLISIIPVLKPEGQLAHRMTKEDFLIAELLIEFIDTAPPALHDLTLNGIRLSDLRPTGPNTQTILQRICETAVMAEPISTVTIGAAEVKAHDVEHTEPRTLRHLSFAVIWFSHDGPDRAAVLLWLLSVAGWIMRQPSRKVLYWRQTPEIEQEIDFDTKAEKKSIFARFVVD